MRLTSVEGWGFCEFATSVLVGFWPITRIRLKGEALRDEHHNFKRFNYLGEWHSHPSFLPEPSATDHKSMREMIEDPKLGANFVVLMVVKLNGAGQQSIWE
jgi:Prokaryotic homologs of the JAB domain